VKLYFRPRPTTSHVSCLDWSYWTTKKLIVFLCRNNTCRRDFRITTASGESGIWWYEEPVQEIVRLYICPRFPLHTIKKL